MNVLALTTISATPDDVLRKLNVRFDAMKLVGELVNGEAYGDLTVCARFIWENAVVPMQEANAPGTYEKVGERVELNEQAKKRFANIMHRVIRAQEGVSRQERLFIQQFWREVQRLPNRTLS